MLINNQNKYFLFLKIPNYRIKFSVDKKIRKKNNDALKLHIKLVLKFCYDVIYNCVQNVDN